VGHQGGAGEPRKHAQQGGDCIGTLQASTEIEFW
jgi:hypothetical protein